MDTFIFLLYIFINILNTLTNSFSNINLIPFHLVENHNITNLTVKHNATNCIIKIFTNSDLESAEFRYKAFKIE